jgi:dethiobiotin synthetase
MKQFFIAGTDTSIGKTYVACQLLNSLNKQTYRAIAIKPVVSGATVKNDALIYEDIALLQQHNNAGNLAINKWHFEAPISPHIAAEQNEVSLTAREILEFCQQEQFKYIPCGLPGGQSNAGLLGEREAILLSNRAGGFTPRAHYEPLNRRDYLLIEGAGGLMAPLNDHETWLDFLTLSRIPVILVVGMRLGCLNHALLAAHALQSQNIACAGWVANCLDPNMLELEANLNTLVQRLTYPLLATIPYQGQFPSSFLIK